jgi:hypothetical protein
MASQPNVNQQVQRVSQVQAKYADMLMSMPHVVGVAVGYISEAGKRTSQIGLVVMVDHKVPASELTPDQVIPRELDGVRVDVQETGVFSAN